MPSMGEMILACTHIYSMNLSNSLADRVCWHNLHVLCLVLIFEAFRTPKFPTKKKIKQTN